MAGHHSVSWSVTTKAGDKDKELAVDDFRFP